MPSSVLSTRSWARKLTSYDPAEGLDSEKGVAVFMEEAFKNKDASYIAHAVRVVARAKGMTQIASDAGIPRETALPRIQRERQCNASNHRRNDEGARYRTGGKSARLTVGNINRQSSCQKPMAPAR